jgi:hypothetical protein
VHLQSATPALTAYSCRTAPSLPLRAVRSVAQSARSNCASRLRIAPPLTSRSPQSTSTVATHRRWQQLDGRRRVAQLHRAVLPTAHDAASSTTSPKNSAASSRAKLLAAALGRETTVTSHERTAASDGSLARFLPSMRECVNLTRLSHQRQNASPVRLVCCWSKF